MGLPLALLGNVATAVKVVLACRLEHCCDTGRSKALLSNASAPETIEEGRRSSGHRELGVLRSRPTSQWCWLAGQALGQSDPRRWANDPADALRRAVDEPGYGFRALTVTRWPG